MAYKVRLGFDSEGREFFGLEMKNTAIRGFVTAELVNGSWHIEIDLGDRIVHGLHESRQGALYLAIGEALGLKVTIERWLPDDEPAANG